MADIFDNQILCKNCKKVMKPVLISKNGFNLRALKCEKCNTFILHPVDKQEYDEFMRLKNKEFEVKMRMVGNSYAVSIPREIVDFMKEQEKMVNDMVKLCFNGANSLSLQFNAPEENDDSTQNPNVQSRVMSSKEVRIVKNGKPVLQARKVFDSAHPERNKTQIIRAKQPNKSEFDEEEDLER